MSSILDTYKNKLHPAIIPDRVEFEMLTVGWYILFGISMVIVIIVGIGLLRSWLKKKYRREANRILDSHIKPLLFHSDNRQEGLRKLSAILKVVAMQSYPSDNVAGLYGESWVNFLNSRCRGVDFYKLQQVNIIDSQYRPNTILSNIESSELEQLFRYAKKWIGGHRV